MMDTGQGRVPKKLYLAADWDGLQKIAEDGRMSQGNLMKQETRAVIRMSETSCKAAEDALKDGDEERAYVLFFRASQLILRYRQNTKADPIYFEAMSKRTMIRSITQCECLSQSLTKRYQVLQKETNLEAVEKIMDALPAQLGDERDDGKNGDATNEGSFSCGVISCRDLYDFLKKTDATSSNPNLLVLDVRPSGEFAQSHIESNLFSRPSVIVLNIPEELLDKCHNMSQFENTIDPSVVRQLKDRRLAGKTVMLDDASSRIMDDTPLSRLFSLLWVFGRNDEKGREAPVLLKGGFSEWFVTYPIHVSNPRYKRVNKVASPISWTLEYTNEEEENVKPEIIESLPVPKSVRGPLENKKSSGQVLQPIVNGNSHVALSSSDEEEMTPRSWTKSHPGSAQPVGIPARSRPLIPDRSSKPLSSSSLPNSTSSPVNSTDKSNSSQHQAENNVERPANALMTDRNHSPESLPKSNITRDSKPGGDTNSRAEIFVEETPEETVSVSSEVSRIRSNDRTVSESKTSESKFGGSTAGGLSRSYSSPNIADIVQQNENHLPTPVFDRTMKPKIAYRAETSKKFREFNALYATTAPGHTGLRNLGLTCFMNAIIQCLSNTRIIYNYFVDRKKYEEEINRNSRFGSRGELAEELAEVLRALWSGHFKSIAPRDFKIAVSNHMPAFVGCEQQDSHEFLTMLLEKLHYDLNRATGVPPIQLASDLKSHIVIQKFWKNHLDRNDSLISRSFEGLLLSTLKCRTCEYESYTCETFTCLSLPISENRCSLLDCLREEFTTIEKLESSWDCDRCKVKRIADRQIKLCRVPPVLVIHLKRFSFDGIWRKKLSTSVDFPLESLDMSDYMHVNHVSRDFSMVYDLTGIVNHTGTLEGGHYTAICKNPSTGKWAKFDDTDVSDLPAADVRTQKTFSAGYVLFYAARDRGMTVV